MSVSGANVALFAPDPMDLARSQRNSVIADNTQSYLTQRLTTGPTCCVCH